MTTRLLETGFETKFHALQIIFVRMFATALIGSFYMWREKVPDFPLGPREVRGLLILRGMAGSVGLFGLYCQNIWTYYTKLTLTNWVDSLSYLDVSDATVITFLVPTLTAFIAWVALRVSQYQVNQNRHLINFARNPLPSMKLQQASSPSRVFSSLLVQLSSSLTRTHFYPDQCPNQPTLLKACFQQPRRHPRSVPLLPAVPSLALLLQRQRILQFV